jgi:peptidyl-prolyl cis-trans isomerase D
MPLMTKMRDNMPAIMIGVVLAFVIMIVFEWGMDFAGLRGQQQNVLGKVNNRVITYQEFSDILRNVTEMQRQQFGGSIDDDFMKYIREQVWSNLVNEILLEEEIERRDIEVTDQEIVNWVYGENPPQFLRQQFVDSLGNFNRVAYDAAITDPRNREQVIQLESMLRQQRKQEKLQSILMASVRITEGEIRQRFMEQNMRMDFDYVLFDPNRVAGADEIDVGEVEIRRYYNANPQKFKIPARRKLDYVLFRFVPSPEDTIEVLEELAYIKEEIERGEDFMKLQEEYTHTPFTDSFFKPGEISPAKEAVVFSAQTGDVIGPIIDTDGIHLIKIIDQRTGREDFIRAQHILLQFEPESDSTTVYERANELLQHFQTGEDFAELAKQYSADPGSAPRGGDLGWFGRGRMVAPFERAAFNARIGEIIGPVESQFGLHIIRVNDRTNREVKFATIHLPVEVSPFTRNKLFDDAGDFAYIADRGDFREEARVLGFTLLETEYFSDEGIIPGIGVNEAVMRFAFGNKVGSVSEVLETQTGYAVFRVADMQREGVKPLDEVNSSIRTDLLREKRMALAQAKAEEIRASLGDQPLSAVAREDADYQVQTAVGVTLTGSIPGIGRDVKLLGAALGLEPGKISPPVEGTRGYYLIYVTDRSGFDEESYASQRESLKESLLQTKRQQFFTQWLEALRKDALIVDNRYMFFR